MQPTFDSLFALAFDAWTLAICGGVYFLLRSINRALDGRTWWRRILPFMPDVLGIGLSTAHLVPSVASQPVAIRVAIGLWIGYLAQRFHKLLGQTILGDDANLTDLLYGAKKSTGEPPAPPSEK